MLDIGLKHNLNAKVLPQRPNLMQYTAAWSHSNSVWYLETFRTINSNIAESKILALKKILAVFFSFFFGQLTSLCTC